MTRRSVDRETQKREEVNESSALGADDIEEINKEGREGLDKVDM